MKFWNAVLRVFDISLGQMLWSRRTVFMALATGAPVVIAVLLRVIHEIGLSSFRINGVAVPGPVIFGVTSGHDAGEIVSIPFGVKARVTASPTARLIIEEAAASD